MAFIEELQEADVWSQIRHISLEETRTVRLMNRIDTKYVAHQRYLLPLLEVAVENGYMVQYTSCALNTYDTTYYDTSSLSMYIMHQNRHLRRQKIRSRTYVDSNTTFLEIKNKNNKGRTKKIRIPITQTEKGWDTLRTDAKLFIEANTPYQPSQLIPTLQTYFHRITLVNREKTERITIDVDVNFKNYVNNHSCRLGELVIIELKQDGRYASMMKEILHGFHIKPFKISKYCIGVALTDFKVKSNRFKRKIHLLNKIKP